MSALSTIRNQFVVRATSAKEAALMALQGTFIESAQTCISANLIECSEFQFLSSLSESTERDCLML